MRRLVGEFSGTIQRRCTSRAQHDARVNDESDSGHRTGPSLIIPSPFTHSLTPSLTHSLNDATRKVVTYYAVGSLADEYIGCFAAGGVGVVGSILDLSLSRVDPAHTWPKLLNTCEMFLYLAMGVLFVCAAACKVWANTIQSAGLTIALLGSMLYSTDFVSEITKDNPNYPPQAARVLAWSIIIAFAIMTGLAAVIPIYRASTSHSADNTLRLLCNWLLPIAALILAPTIAMSVLTPKSKGNEDGETAGLIGGEGSQGDERKSSSSSDPGLFVMLLGLSLIPVAIIAILAMVYDDDSCT